MSEIATITVQRLAELNEQGDVEVIDVRTPAEFRQLHATIARNVPLDSLDACAVMTGRGNNAEQPLYVICQSGVRGLNACQKFMEAGHSNVVNVEGGTSAWEAAGLPVVRGKKTISLENQVRIAAGSVVLLGAILSFLNPYFVLLSAFVGAGLIFVGFTGNCMMATVLGKMPWNQVTDTGGCCEA